ncbi:LysR family transcriptional regulator [Tropicimonas sp. IMCC34043]|uniref:LysR family transcriptional regulator n=1 Tax=Tropicimonas sp. IMCC34043 TaxID=2248760 RepID=UPI000E23E5DF|nr:LysR family transcriptional regulator [Tropicimonas sp. IMCC34043]
MDLIDGLRAFVATAQTGSFTAAADRLGVSNRLTSKYVAELEARLGARLLQRTTRRVGLTPAGERLLARAPAWLEDLDDLLGDVTENAQGFSGTLRVSAPVTFGEMRVTGLLTRFAAPHPDLTIDLRLSDAFVDLAAEGIDVAFRIGTLPDSALLARRLGGIRMLVVASPDYVADHGAPQVPADLADHICIYDTNRRGGRRWRFGEGSAAQEVAVSGHFMVNSARVARDLAVAGQGIICCPDFVLGADLAEGRLVPLLVDYPTPLFDISAVHLAGAVLPRKVRALIDFAVEDMGRVHA